MKFFKLLKMAVKVWQSKQTIKQTVRDLQLMIRAEEIDSVMGLISSTLVWSPGTQDHWRGTGPMVHSNLVRLIEAQHIRLHGYSKVRLWKYCKSQEIGCGYYSILVKHKELDWYDLGLKLMLEFESNTLYLVEDPQWSEFK